MQFRFICSAVLCTALAAVCASPAGALGQSSAAGASATQTGDVILTPADTAKILPSSVYFKGHSTTIETRNSGGVRFSDGLQMLAVLVDASGYSSGLQQKYQAYLITETALQVGGHRLAPGTYGCGFTANNQFVVMDIGGHDLLSAHWAHDEVVHRPRPLWIATGAKAGEFRLYEGRNYVEFSRDK